MTTIQPNEFQQRAEERLRQLLVAADKQLHDREVLCGKVPFYGPDLQVYVRGKIGGIEVWIFDNEASLDGPDGVERFEWQDYDCEDSLLDAFLTALRQAIDQRS